MIKGKNFGIGIILLVVLFSFSLVSAYDSFNAQTRSANSFSILSGLGADISGFSQESCARSNDFVLQIAPGSCTPLIVRSDLLEENNVPVFCPIMATKINPLIDVDAIDSISFSGEYPSEVSGVGFHPARAAVGSTSRLINTPIDTNIGYAVIVLRRQANESAMPDWVEGTLNARLRYDAGNAFGIGEANFYLQEIGSEDVWENTFRNYGFWGGRAYIRAESVGEDEATIVLYRDVDDVVTSFNLKKGDTSNKIYMPGFYCQAGLQVKLEDLSVPKTTAQFEVDGQVFSVPQGGKFLDNACTVRRITKQGGLEEVAFSCRTDDGNKNFELSIQPRVSVNDQSVLIGDKISGTGNVYLIDVKDNTRFYFLKAGETITGERLTDAQLNGLNQIILAEGFSSGQTSEFGAIYVVTRTGEDPVTSSDLSTVTLNGFVEAENADFGIDFKDKFDNSISSYEALRLDYPDENYRQANGVELDETYAERGLYEAILLASEKKQIETLNRLVGDFVDNYPDSVYMSPVLQIADPVRRANSEFNTVGIFVNGKSRFIEFRDVDVPGADDLGVGISVKTAGADVNGDTITLVDSPVSIGSGTTDTIELAAVESDYAMLKLNYKNAQGNAASSTVKATLRGNWVTLGSYQVKVNSILLNKRADVKIIPSIDNLGTEAEFNFRIGIEKRALQLTPEKTKDRIEKLNKTIEKWSEISEDLGNVVSVMKGACLTVGTYLTVKNLFTNLDGSSIARRDVMSGDDGWYKRCEAWARDETRGYSSVDDCLFTNNDLIEAEVESRTQAIKDVNDAIKRTSEADESYGVEVMTQVSNAQRTNSQIEVGDVNQDKLDSLSHEDLRQLHTDAIEVRSATGERKTFLETRINSVLGEARSADQIESAVNAYMVQSQTSFRNLGSSEYQETSGETSQFYEYTGGVTTTQVGQIREGRPVQAITSGEDIYLVELNPELAQVGGNTAQVYGVANVYGRDGKSLPAGTTAPEGLATATFNQINLEDSCTGNAITNPTVRYSGRNPALVTFDTTNGWYAVPTEFEDSGAVRQFYVCNVGSDGVINNPLVGYGNNYDMCFLVNEFTGQDNLISCLDETQSRRIVEKARAAIRDASRAYRDGVRTVSIGGTGVPVGEPFTGAAGAQCTDFMSPKDCKLMFNVCDPVVCPSSRCDFGGAYKVDNVIQSGIVGSIALCLPNAKEGIVIPVCLSGIKAGLDGLLSVFTNYRDCLQESLDSGRSVGICDEVHSIYLCEFLWKQAIPLVKLAIPHVLSAVSGHSLHGGGEYMGVVDAWNNAGASVDYFTNYYAANSYAAFNVRATDEAGTDICRAFISARYPTSGDFFDALLAPDSPSQFHGWFEEIPFTSATVPPTSQYKVFYHIFAGEDQGVSYSVRLSQPEGTSLYQTTGSYSVASGYIAKGDYASETKDFIAPRGYKKLCISVNAQEACGFTSVSTSAAVTYIQEEYTQSQAERTDITSEDECVYGSVDFSASVINPNLQAGVDESINPEIYNRGIVRVCSTANPGQATNPDRWVDVGHCGNEQLRCWLDEESVEDAITIEGLEESTLNEVSQRNLDRLFAEGGYMQDPEYIGLIEDLVELVGREPRPEGTATESTAAAEASNIENTYYGQVFWSYRKAELIYFRARLYNWLATQAIAEVIEDAVAGSEENAGEVGESSNGETGIEITDNIITITSTSQTITLEEGEFVRVSISGVNHILENVNGHLKISSDAVQIKTKRDARGSYPLKKIDVDGDKTYDVQVEVVSESGSALEFEISLASGNASAGRVSGGTGFSCRECDGLFNSCEVEECDAIGAGNCFYKETFAGIGDNCLDCDRVDSCSDYNNEEACVADSCGSGESQSSGSRYITCYWDGDSCEREVTSPGGGSNRDSENVGEQENADVLEFTETTTHFEDWQRDFSNVYLMPEGSAGRAIEEETTTNLLYFCEDRDLNFVMVKALIKQESSWNPDTINDNGGSVDWGLMQVNDALHGPVEDVGEGGVCENMCPDLGDVLFRTEFYKTDDDANFMFGTCYLKCLREYYGITDSRSLIAAYNAGPTNSARTGTISSMCKADFTQCTSSDFPSSTRNTYVVRLGNFYDQAISQA